MTPDQACNGILGLLVGDALGVPYEFTRPENLPPKARLEYEPPRGFPKAWPKVPAGTWSDDGAQALCILDAILHGGEDEKIEDVVGHRLVAWYQQGFMAVDNLVFDIGNTTRTALHRIMEGVPASKAGCIGESTHANGSLMRTLPIAFMRGTDDQIIRAAMGQSRVTHAEPVPMLCCAFYCLWARRLADTRDVQKSWDEAWDAIFAATPKGILWANLMHIQGWPGPPNGLGLLHRLPALNQTGADGGGQLRGRGEARHRAR